MTLAVAIPAAAPLPPVYLPRDVASALHCSEWWVKEQARRGRIPFSKVGGGYRFTAEHFAEIMRIFESRPAGGKGTATTAATRAQRHQAHTETVAGARLTARIPRRAQRSQSQSSAA